ncbi:type VII secretion-associated protein [Nocardia vaccinii]|uniref:type VII secretion-associated protein n=1 Tax=Nocardia vaccinii TaxID=1822 RepID=UPI000B22A6F5|nr:type VII secretion-associated protein [Nocardia vaccinii]
MSTVDIVLTDTRVWARSESTHWDGPPSIVPASDDRSFVVGEQLRPQYPAVSMVRMAAADRIAFAPALPTVTDAWAVTLGAVLTNLQLPTPCEQLTIVGPSAWGRRRRAALETAARRLVSQVTVEPLARRAASLEASTAQQQRIAVLELDPLCTTVTLIGRSGQDTWIEAGEFEPSVGLADVEEGHGMPGVVGVIARLLAGQAPTYLLALGVTDRGLLDALAATLAEQCGFPVDVRPLTGVELIRGAHPGMPMPIAQTAQPAGAQGSRSARTEFDSLHEHALATQPPRQGPNRLLIAAAAVIALLLVGVGVTVALTRSGSSHTTTAAESAGPSTTPAAATSVSRPTTQTFGRVQAQIPAGWHIASRLGDRVDVSPDNGARQRITLMQKTLNPGAGLDDVAETLDAQIKRRPAGQVSDLQRNAVFGDRPGLSYEESPGDGTTVRWQILVDSGLQASVGCQYAQGNWQPLSAPCEQFVHTLRITG